MDDASWMPASNFDYPEELQKMVERDNPVKDTAVLLDSFGVETTPRGR